MTRCRFYIALLPIFLFVISAVGNDGALDPGFTAGVAWRNGPVIDFARQSDGKIVIVGSFTVVDGRSYNCVARLNADGSLDTGFNVGRGAGFNSVGCNGSVRAVAIQPDGKIIVGGGFSTFGNTGPTELRSNLARLNPDGSLDASFIGTAPGSGPSGQVDDIAVQPDGKVLIASFNTTLYSGTPVGYFARINADGTLDSVFNTNIGAGFNNSTSTIEIQSDGRILVGGGFTQVGTTAASRIARLNDNGSVDTVFAANAGSGASNSVADIIVQSDSRILICGVFDSFNGVASNRMARLNANGSRDATFTSPVTNTATVNALAIDSLGRIVAAGSEAFFDDGVSQRNAIARLQASNGAVDSTFTIGGGTDGTINAIGFQGPDILVAGGFTRINGKSQLSFCRLLPSGVVNADFEPVIGTPGTVNAIAVQFDGKILAGGNFYGANSTLRQRLTRFNPDGTTDTGFFPGQGEADTDMEVMSIAVQTDGKILVGGNFNNFGGVANAGLTRLNPDGSVDQTFSATAISVRSIAIQTDGKIVIGGLFGSVNGVLGHNRIARLNSDGSLDPTFTATGAACNCGVEKVLIQNDGKILAGGYFDEFNGTAGINNLVRLTSTGAIDAAFTAAGGTGFSGTVYDIDIQPADGKILATGWFNGYGTNQSPGLARLNPTGSFDAGFNVGSGFNSVAAQNLIIQKDGRLLVVGSFSQYQSVTRLGIVRILATGAIDPTFAPSDYLQPGGASAIGLQSNGSIIVGGSFNVFGDANGTPRFGIARLRNGNWASFRAPFDFDGDGRTDISIYRPSDLTWWLRQSQNGGITHTFGALSDSPVPADFTGDGKTDIAVFRPSTSEWFVLRSENLTYYSFPFGTPGDIPAPGDFDGSGLADAAVYRPSLGFWFIRLDSGATIIQPFGNATDKPTVADFDGDSVADVAIFRPSNGQWWIRQSSTGTVVVNTFGQINDRPTPGDFTGDGVGDIAVWRPSDGNWYVRRSEDGSFFTIALGANGDKPVPGDYDGDGKIEAAVFRPADRDWYVASSWTGGIQIVNYGLPTDVPLPGSFIR